jgi:hypothetical protein
MTAELGPFMYTASPQNPDKFRNVDWTTQLGLLTNILTTNSCVIGNYSIDQLQFIKNYFKESAVLITHSYQTFEYDFFLEQFAKQHVYLQDVGSLPLTETDQAVRSNGEDLVQYYKQTFDQQQIIPKQINWSGDYDVPVRDFYNPDRFFQHITNLSTTPSTQAIAYYQQWQKLKLGDYYENV